MDTIGSIKVSTNIKRIAITDDHDQQIGVIEFNPTDVNFADRFYKLLGDVEGKEAELTRRQAELDSVTEVTELGIPVNLGERIDFQKEACEFMFAEIDQLFGAGTSEMVFRGIYDPFMVDDFLQGIAPYFQDTRAEKLAKYAPQRRVSKHAKGRTPKRKK